MPVTISKQDYWDLIYETQYQQSPNHNDKFDVIYQYPEQLGKGTYREIQLRQGVELTIDRYQLHDSVIMQSPERSHLLEYVFALSEKPASNSIGQYELYGSGVAPKEKWEQSATEPILQVSVHIEPEVFQTFLGDRELASIGLEHLMRCDRYYYNRRGTTTVAMQTVLHQILHCPFQDITKKIYLESKVWELMALLIEEEKELHQEKRKKHSTFTLKPEDIDRIHHAKEILTKQIDNPPLLLDLARQVGLNDCTLKRGFRQVFGTTAFGYLNDYRLEQARQLLLEKHLNVSEIASQVGFGSCSYLSKVFRKKYGVSPKQYQKIGCNL